MPTITTLTANITDRQFPYTLLWYLFMMTCIWYFMALLCISEKRKNCLTSNWCQLVPLFPHLCFKLSPKIVSFMWWPKVFLVWPRMQNRQWLCCQMGIEKNSEKCPDFQFFSSSNDSVPYSYLAILMRTFGMTNLNWSFMDKFHPMSRRVHLSYCQISKFGAKSAKLFPFFHLK